MGTFDVAVEGIADARAFLDLLGRAADMTEFPLDLVEWKSSTGKAGRRSCVEPGSCMSGKDKIRLLQGEIARIVRSVGESEASAASSSRSPW